MKKIIVYQVLARLWRDGRFSSFDSASLEYFKSLGVTHLWLCGIPRHATGEPFVKGNPGSPYAVCDWFDTNPYLGSMREFRELAHRIHRAGLKLITDFIPNHTARNYSDKRGGIPLCGHCDYDWTDTLKVDYSNPGTVGKMSEILDFWADAGVDGFRCDMVELVPREALAAIIGTARSRHPELIFIAEAYERANYRPLLEEAGFDLLYDKSGCYDILRAIMGGSSTTQAITGNWQWLGGMQGRMLNFLENHDEQRLASSFFASDARKGYAALAVAALFNNASFLLYSGQETGESAAESGNGRTSIFDFVHPESMRLLDGMLRGTPLPDFEASVLERYRSVMELASSPLCNGDNWDLNYYNEGSRGFDCRRHFAFLRYLKGEGCILVFCNFCDCTARATVCIPAEALSASGLPSGAAEYQVEASPWDFETIKL